MCAPLVPRLLNQAARAAVVRKCERGWMTTWPFGFWFCVAVLGVGQEASDAEIKKAYRKLSLQYHPGVCVWHVMRVALRSEWVGVFGGGSVLAKTTWPPTCCFFLGG